MDWSEDLNSLGRVAIAGVLGALIGLEREIRDKPAGLRTHIFVCAGAALFMILGDAILQSFKAEGHEGIQADPIRVVQAVVIGISFLGTGTIIHQGSDRVEGLTTAAAIFLTAGIGIAVAVDHMVLAVGSTLFAVVVLVGVGWLEHWFETRSHSKPHPSKKR
jgi:putative Mg2+ transporter-C (MgtC) family protein